MGGILDSGSFEDPACIHSVSACRHVYRQQAVPDYEPEAVYDYYLYFVIYFGGIPAD